MEATTPPFSPRTSGQTLSDQQGPAGRLRERMGLLVVERRGVGHPWSRTAPSPGRPGRRRIQGACHGSYPFPLNALFPAPPVRPFGASNGFRDRAPASVPPRWQGPEPVGLCVSLRWAPGNQAPHSAPPVARHRAGAGLTPPLDTLYRLQRALSGPWIRGKATGPAEEGWALFQCISAHERSISPGGPLSCVSGGRETTQGHVPCCVACSRRSIARSRRRLRPWRSFPRG